jgi:alpha-beta hydrolase superfamily lysophospholipase
VREVRAALPVEVDRLDGLAYSLWLPDGAPSGGVVILHGAGSCKESHHDYARAALASGLGAIAFDQRGHGESSGALDGNVLDDVVAMGSLLRERVGPDGVPLAVRGSSMGGYLALLAARPLGASAVVAICPASGTGLARGLRSGRFSFAADPDSLEAFLLGHALEEEVGLLEVPVLLLHAEGDEQVPVQHSRELAARLRHPMSRLVAVPGGHHRSVQHDAELQALSLRFIVRAFETLRGDERTASP